MLELPSNAFARYDEAPDDRFYEAPRLITHIDVGAISAVTQLYREYLPPGGRILDLMSSWVSHLPPEVQYDRVVGLGMNVEELAHNPQLDSYVVQDLNRHPRLPFGDREFDGSGLCVSVQYLTQPVAVLRELGRVLQAGAPVSITFSNRCFPTKAVLIWQHLDDAGHSRLVQRYLEEAGNWTSIESHNRSLHRRGGDPLFAIVARSTGTMAK